MRSVLVANRGEIALRIVRAAHDLGLEAIAVHSEADSGQPHVRLADAAVEIGPPPAARSYLDVEAILGAARDTGAEAVHPGYGFLAERAGFARACEQAGLRFVGPVPEHIDLMGDKARAREVAREADVPTIPGSEGPVDGVDAAAAIAGEVGWPVALKAAGGGGGRGIRIASDERELRKAYATAAREAEAAFDDGRLYVERFVTPARHVEVQVLGDGERTVHLGERDCSLQRRRQKVVEETPAPGLAPRARERLCAAALRLCEAVGYRSAGTVEFLVEAGGEGFFFIEMNTRIQVEHPVTELVYGVDLVAEQLRVAAGESLRLHQEDLAPRGAALELRVTAEDPSNGWLPSPGPVPDVVLPAGPWVRVDSWLEPGGEVPPFYDALLAKLVVWGEDRRAAIARAMRALRELRIDGVMTTASMLDRLLRESWFADGDFHTATLEAWLAHERSTDALAS